MITNRMSYDEIHHQLSFDISTFEKSKEYKEIFNKYRRETRRSKKEFIKFRLHSFKSEKFQNEWFMIINAERSSDCYYFDISYYTFRYLERGGMICYSIVCDGHSNLKYLIVFPQHF